jgi:hypothetical protein
MQNQKINSPVSLHIIAGNKYDENAARNREQITRINGTI